VLNQGQNFIKYKGVCLPSTCEITAKRLSVDALDVTNMTINEYVKKKKKEKKL